MKPFGYVTRSRHVRLRVHAEDQMFLFDGYVCVFLSPGCNHPFFVFSESVGSTFATVAIASFSQTDSRRWARAPTDSLLQTRGNDM